jgi:uncharacterized damage-inducible protein DinB
MDPSQLFGSLYEYDLAMMRRIWDSIRTLDAEAFTRPVDYSRGSLRDQMVHLVQTNRRWLAGLKGEPEPGRLAPADFPEVESVKTLWDAVATEWLAYANGLDDATVEQAAPGMPGPRWEVLLHVANHGTDHRSQILRLLHDLGAPTFDQDFILYQWNIGR